VNIYNLPSDTSRFPVQAGALVRRPLRRYLDRQGIRYREEKGWFDSQFIILNATTFQIADIIAWIERVNADG
jgi:hypothetical protein